MTLHTSALFDEKTFYQQFLKDLLSCKSEVIIESPYITCERMNTFRSIFEELVNRNVKIFIITRSPEEHEGGYQKQAEREIAYFEHSGIQALLCTGNHHRKLAILDRKVLWEGSLNILSQMYSREIMRRIESETIALEMFSFLKLASVI